MLAQARRDELRPCGPGSPSSRSRLAARSVDALGVDVLDGVATDLGQRRRARAEHGHCPFHRLEQRQPEALAQRGVDEQLGPGVDRVERPIVDPAGEGHGIRNARARRRRRRARACAWPAPPTSTSLISGRCARTCANASTRRTQVLVRLAGRDREHVGLARPRRVGAEARRLVVAQRDAAGARGRGARRRRGRGRRRTAPRRRDGSPRSR